MSTALVEDLYVEIVTERIGNCVLASTLRPATKREV